MQVKNQGFTLIEIMVVLAISTALLVLVVPSLYRSIAATDIPKATKELALALRLSQSQAINSTKSASLVLNVKNRQYHLSYKNKKIQLPKQIELTLLTGSTLLQQGMEDDEGAIVFYPDGSSTGGQITLKKDQKSQQIDIDWLTGEVSISDHE